MWVVCGTRVCDVWRVCVMCGVYVGDYVVSVYVLCGMGYVCVCVVCNVM